MFKSSRNSCSKFQEVEQRGVQKLSVAKSVVKLGLGKNKLESSKSEERGVREMDHKEDIIDGNGNGDNGGNGKPRVGKKKPKRKSDKLKCFLCDGPHMLKKCPKKFALKEKPVSKALVLGSSARGVEAKEAESEKKPVECFLCHGPHTLRKCLKKSVIEGNDGVDKEPKKLGSSKGKAKGKKAKRSKKKRVKCFLCRGPHELRNYPKQAGVKRKAMSELGELSERLPPKEELAESSTRLPPMGEVGGASDFKEKEVMHVGQLTRVNAKIARQVKEKPRQRECSKVNQASTIRKSQRGRCENG
ncbi:hypothetical protein Gotur_026292, partial [Gossypium turneri]